MFRSCAVRSFARRSCAQTATALTLTILCFWITTAWPAVAKAQAYPRYVASVPFDFRMNDAVLPAGTYQITALSPHLLRFRAIGKTHVADLAVFPADDTRNTPTGHLLFMQYGTLYFLHEFSAPDESRGNYAGLHPTSRCIRTPGEDRAARQLIRTGNVGAAQGIEVAVNAAHRR